MGLHAKVGPKAYAHPVIITIIRGFFHIGKSGLFYSNLIKKKRLHHGNKPVKAMKILERLGI